MSKNIEISQLSDLLLEEAEHLIGRTIVKVEASEYLLVLTFEDGTNLQIGGSSYGGSLDATIYNVDDTAFWKGV